MSIFWLDNRGTADNGKTHLAFEWGGKKVLYCYIRKNACTTMKRVMFGSMGLTADPSGAKFPFNFFKNRMQPEPANIETFDMSLLIYRDPIDRTVSLFQNKFIERNGAAGILRNYRDITGQDGDKATFLQFVKRYLRQRTEMDPHCAAQHEHLAPIVYTHVVRMEQLHAAMVEVFGAERADAYFQRPANAVSMRRFDEPAATIPAEQLRERFLQSGEVPSRRSLINEETEAAIRKRYLRDFQLIERIEGQPLQMAG